MARKSGQTERMKYSVRVYMKIDTFSKLKEYSKKLDPYIQYGDEENLSRSARILIEKSLSNETTKDLLTHEREKV